MKKTKAPARKPKAASTGPKESASPYEPTPEELSAIKAHFAQQRQEAAIPRITVSEDNQLEVSHPDPQVGKILLARGLGTSRGVFADGLLSQLAIASMHNGKISEQVFNYLIAFVVSMKPRDEMEAALATEMAITHHLTTAMGRRLAQAEMLLQQDSAERAFNKLARTFATQIETLRRYRTGGEQNIVVKHVTVNSGGQAIVGSVTHGAVAGAKNGGSPEITVSEEKPVSLLAVPDQELMVAEGGGVGFKNPQSTS
jgi:hypothetical protein